MSKLQNQSEQMVITIHAKQIHSIKKRKDLIGQTGSVTRNLKIIDAVEYPTGVSVRVSENETGEEYWTGLEDIELDE